MNKPKRVIIVTGGGSGMGELIAKRFAANGDFVYIIGRDLDKLEAVAKTNSDLLIPVRADLSKPEEVERVVTVVSEKHESINVLVNCAGTSGHVEPDQKLSDAKTAWDDILSNNLTSAFLMIYAFRPLLKRPGGRIINITSSAAFAGSSRVGGEAYAAAKAAIHGMTRTLVRQLGPEGITVNCVAPGFVMKTDFFKTPPPKELIDSFVSRTPAGRVGYPEDIAPAVFYLASDEASFVNGEILNVNGGQQFSR